MCCFSGSVRSVSRTRIFVRPSEGETQFVVYQMTYTADVPVAMILPLPVWTDARRRAAVRFLSLKGYPPFFDDLEKIFPQPRESMMGGGTMPGGMAPAHPLPVERVGDYIASFVPHQNDFARLDHRFVIPKATWAKLPKYNDYGFVVFQLVGHLGEATTPHPMALQFGTRDPKALFFPTVHIHDGQVHAREYFDHVLYAQATGVIESPFVRSQKTAGTAVKIAQTAGIVLADSPLLRHALYGVRPNQDRVIRLL